MSINAERCFFIRLGRSGEWTAECIAAGQLRLDYPEVSHEFCVDRRWTQVQSQISAQSKDREASAGHVNQLRAFYEASPATLWITFHSNCMWWCFANPDVSLLADGSRVRTVMRPWQQTDMSNKSLTASRLSGSLVAVQAYRGSICAVDPSYILHKINGIDPPSLEAANRALGALVYAVHPIVERLHPRDLEVLVDLIFRNAGWNRVGVLAETETDIDLALESPVTGERIAVEIKARASISDYQGYSARFSAMVGFDRLYFVTHSVIPELASQDEGAGGAAVKFWGSRTLAERAVGSGLAQWLIDKAV